MEENEKDYYAPSRLLTDRRLFQRTKNEDRDGFLQLYAGRLNDGYLWSDGWNNDITVLSLKMIYDKSMFGDIDFTTITEEEKTQMIDAILTQSGITEDMKGVTTKVEIEDTIIATIEMNLKEADPDTLKNLGFDFSNTDMSFDKVVQDMKDQGFDCK